MRDSAAGLWPADLARVVDQFGVAEEQVRRDHTISHVLAVLSQHHRSHVIFVGGTALSRAYLVDERLSEDIDLIATENRDELAEDLPQSSDSSTRAHPSAGRTNAISR
ncbi:MAG: nucleotidyl transferase AbiEii/AbiGii toxin family protein [Nocardioidaceae bacterium]